MEKNPSVLVNALDTTFQIRNQMSENEKKEALERIKSTKIE